MTHQGLAVATTLGVGRWGVCGRQRRGLRQGATWGCGPGTYSNESEGAFRIDGNAIGKMESGAGADSVVLEVLEAILMVIIAARAAAGERGCLPALEVNLPDAVVVSVLTCI